MQTSASIVSRTPLKPARENTPPQLSQNSRREYGGRKHEATKLRRLTKRCVSLASGIARRKRFLPQSHSDTEMFTEDGHSAIKRDITTSSQFPMTNYKLPIPIYHFPIPPLSLPPRLCENLCASVALWQKTSRTLRPPRSRTTSSCVFVTSWLRVFSPRIFCRNRRNLRRSFLPRSFLLTFRSSVPPRRASIFDRRRNFLARRGVWQRANARVRLRRRKFERRRL